MRTLLAVSLLAVMAAPSFAQEATPEGQWRDKFGTTVEFSLCGDGTQLCAVLLDVQGKSRTKANLAYVNRQVVKADKTAANEWQGTVTFNGTTAAGKVTQVAADVMEVEGCKAAILCQTLAFNRL